MLNFLYYKAHEILDEIEIAELFKLLLKRYQIGSEKSMKVVILLLIMLIFLLYYKCYEINLNCDGSYIVSTDWIKNNNESCL